MHKAATGDTNMVFNHSVTKFWKEKVFVVNKRLFICLFGFERIVLDACIGFALVCRIHSQHTHVHSFTTAPTTTCRSSIKTSSTWCCMQSHHVFRSATMKGSRLEQSRSAAFQTQRRPLPDAPARRGSYNRSRGWAVALAAAVIFCVPLAFNGRLLTFLGVDAAHVTSRGISSPVPTVL